MKRCVTTILVVFVILNLIVSKPAYAEYEDIIDGSITKENLTDVEKGMSNDLGESLMERGEADSYPASKKSDDSQEYNTRKETSTVENTPSSGGAISGILAGIINVLPNAISFCINFLVLSQEPDDTTIKEFTIQDLVFNNFDLFDINFFKEADNPKTVNAKLKTQVAKWYSITRRMAIVMSLCVLIYIGIRMAISTVADEKAKYKKMLTSWFVGFCLIFLLHYIIIAAINVSEGIGSIIPQGDENLEETILYGNGNANSKGLKDKMSSGKGWNFVMVCILYWIIIYYQVKFVFLYLFRLLATIFLTLISPFICVTYAIDKVGDNKAQAYTAWLKEIMVNIFIQPLHAMLYIIFITSAAEIAQVAPLFAILFFAALSRGEKIVKNLFNIRGLSSINSIGTKAQ